MAEIKDKIITAESLAAVHTYNKNNYMKLNNPDGNGTFSMNGDANFTGNIDTTSISIGNAVLSYDATENALKVSFIANEE